MARKPLLTESQIRSFMKLAELRPIGQERMQEINGLPDMTEEEADPEELEKFAADDLEDDSLKGDEEAADDEIEADAEMGADIDMEPAMDAEGGADMVSVDDFMGALETALEDVLGEPVSTEMDVEDDMEDMEVDADMAADDELEDEVGMAVDAEEDEIEDMDMMESQEDIVNEIARRVANRLQQENSKAHVIDTLAERIMKRLTK